MEKTSETEKKCEQDLIPVYNLVKMSKAEYCRLKEEVAKDIVPHIEHPVVNHATFVGLEDVKEHLWEALFDQKTMKIRCNKILFYGPTGSGKSHLIRVLASRLNATLFKVNMYNFHCWAKNMNVITKIFAEFAEECQIVTRHVILFLDHFDWFYNALCSETDYEEPDRQAVIRFLSTIHTHWGKYSNAQVVVVAATYQPWFLDKPVIEQFQKRVYLRPLNMEERRLLINKKSWEYTNGMDITAAELKVIIQSTSEFSAWELVDLVKNAIREQNGRGDFITESLIVSCATLDFHYTCKPLTRVELFAALAKMLSTPMTPLTGKDKLVKFDDFNKKYGNCPENTAEKNVQLDGPPQKNNFFTQFIFCCCCNVLD